MHTNYKIQTKQIQKCTRTNTWLTVNKLFSFYSNIEFFCKYTQIMPSIGYRKLKLESDTQIKQTTNCFPCITWLIIREIIRVRILCVIYN